MGVGATGEPTVSMRPGDDHADTQKQAKQFNKEIDQAKEAPDDEAPSADNAPQRKAVGGWPTTSSLYSTLPQFTDEQAYDVDAALKRIDAQIAEERAILQKPYEKRLQQVRNRVSDGMDTWATPKYNATKMTGDMVWEYGRNNTWTDSQGRELPFFIEDEKKLVYEDQDSKQQWAQQQLKEAHERELTRAQIARDAQVKAGFDRIRSPAAVIQPFAFGALGASVFAAYAGIQTGKSVGDAYNACKNGPATDCLAATTHAGIAIATDVYALKSGAPGKGPQAGASVTGEIVNRKLPGGEPHAPAEPKVIVDRSAYMVEPGQAGMSKALGLDPSKTRVVANASDGKGADFQVVASGQRPVGAGGRSTPPPIPGAAASGPAAPPGATAPSPRGSAVWFMPPDGDRARLVVVYEGKAGYVSTGSVVSRDMAGNEVTKQAGAIYEIRGAQERTRFTLAMVPADPIKNGGFDDQLLIFDKGWLIKGQGFTSTEFKPPTMPWNEVEFQVQGTITNPQKLNEWIRSQGARAIGDAEPMLPDEYRVVPSTKQTR